MILIWTFQIDAHSSTSSVIRQVGNLNGWAISENARAYYRLSWIQLWRKLVYCQLPIKRNHYEIKWNSSPSHLRIQWEKLIVCWLERFLHNDRSNIPSPQQQDDIFSQQSLTKTEFFIAESLAAYQLHSLLFIVDALLCHVTI